MKKKVCELKSGDRTEWYTVREVIQHTDSLVVVEICYNDGGISERTWDDPKMMIEC